MFEIGQRLTLHYPDSTLVSASPTFRPRHLVVRAVRDLVQQPLTPAEFLKRPLIHRGRYLIRASCPGQGFRQFYPASSRELRRSTPLRLGFYDPNDSGLLDVVPVSFGPSVRDRLLLARTVIQLQHDPPPGLLVRIFADDLQIVRAA